MKKYLLLMLCLATATTAIFAQKKVRVEQQTIFNEDFVLPALLTEISRDDTYTVLQTRLNSTQQITSPLALNSSFGREVGLNQNPNFIFEILEQTPKNFVPQYIKTSDVLPYAPGIIIRLILASDYQLIVKDGQNVTLKTIILTDKSQFKTYYYCITPQGPALIPEDKIKSSPISGWLTDEIAAAAFANVAQPLQVDLFNAINQEQTDKAWQILHTLMRRYSFPSGTPKMPVISKKMQANYPNEMQLLNQIKIAFNNWAADRYSPQAIQIIRQIAELTRQKAVSVDDNNLQFIFLLNAAIAYTMAHDFDQAALTGHHASQCDKSFFGHFGHTFPGLYCELKKQDFYKKNDLIKLNQINFNYLNDYNYMVGK